MKLSQNQAYLSKTNTNGLKGILALCVLLCHLWPNVASSISSGIIKSGVGVVLTAFGYLSVSLFFFLSGYGLMVQYRKRGSSYLKGFLIQRVLPLYLLCVILIVFYWCVRLTFGESVLIGEVLQSFFFGGTVISKGWYLQSILLWYILFFFSFRCFSNEKWQMLAIFSSFAIYVALCLILRLSSTWYEGAFLLPLGIFWAKHQEAIDAYLDRKYGLPLLLSWMLFAITFFFGNFRFLPIFLATISKCASALFFVIAVILLLRILPIDNPITRFLGRMYLEIYVIHGFVLMLFHSKYIYLTNPLLYGVVVILVSILLAWLLKPLFAKILHLGKRKKYE